MALMKVTTNGKVYEYDRKTLFVPEKTHREMKMMAMENGITLQEFVIKTFDTYKKHYK